MHVPPVIRGGRAVRSLSLLLGLAVFAFSIVLMLESRLGLSPWDVLNQGISRHTPLSFGLANVAVSVVVLALAWRLGARIGIGTVANAVLIGLLVDGFETVDAVAGLSGESLPARVGMLAAGLVLIGIGSGLYIGADLGAGPRDSLMLVGAARTRVRLGGVRFGIELAATVAGVALGGTVGVGTIAFVLAVGPSVELGFRALVVLGLARPVPVRVATTIA